MTPVPNPAVGSQALSEDAGETRQALEGLKGGLEEVLGPPDVDEQPAELTCQGVKVVEVGGDRAVGFAVVRFQVRGPTGEIGSSLAVSD